MIYHLIDVLKYSVTEHETNGHAWVDFRKYEPNNTTALVKDMIDSDNFLRAVIKWHNPSKHRLFHVFYITNKKKSFFLTDAVLNMFPGTDERLNFSLQVADWCLNHGYATTDDIVWFLNHSGHFNPKNPTSVESESLVKLYQVSGKTKCACGQLDTALSVEARQIKNNCNNPRDAKIVVVNDINEGNSIVKSFMLNGWQCYGFLIGPDVPVVVNSRFNLCMNDATLELLGVNYI